MNKTKSLFFEKLTKMTKLLAENDFFHIEKKKKTQITRIKTERRDPVNYSIDMKAIIGMHYEYSNKLDALKKKHEFLERYKLHKH